MSCGNQTMDVFSYFGGGGVQSCKINWRKETAMGVPQTFLGASLPNRWYFVWSLKNCDPWLQDLHWEKLIVYTDLYYTLTDSTSCSSDDANGDLLLGQNKAWYPQKELLASAICWYYCIHGECWSPGVAEQKLQLEGPVSVLPAKEAMGSPEGSSVRKGEQFPIKV